ncbi:MAG: hypothetical protein Q9O74_07920 [Planctomycetota bacterium]|nr:hypothetical protein [Planctomycetota bacterium]
MDKLLRIAASAATVVCFATAPHTAHAQHSYTHTFTVDPSGNADYTTIQAAINALPSPMVPTTILIYAGTYTEALTVVDSELDIVGINREGVVIKPPADTDAITIKGNGARLNTIRNLTIWTNDPTTGEGRGVVIENNGGADPTDIGIDGVTFRIDGANSDAIRLNDRAHSIEISNVTVLGAGEDTIKGICVTGGTSADPSVGLTISNVVMLLDGCSAKGVTFEDEAEDVTITGLVIRKPSFGGRGIEAEMATNLYVENCDVLAHDGDGLIVGPNTIVRDSSIIVRKAYGSDDGCGTSSDDKPGIKIGDIDGVVVDNCFLEGRLSGIVIGTGADDVSVISSDILGGIAGATIKGASGVSLTNCRIAGDSALGTGTGLPQEQHYGVRVLGTTSGLTLASSVVSAHSTTARDAMGILVETAPTDRPLQVLDCVVSADVTSAATGVAHAVQSEDAEGIDMIGGSADATDEDEREVDVYDVYNASASEVRVRTSGTQYSRWKGAIGAAVGPEVQTLRVVRVPSAGAATVLATKSLTGLEQTIVTGINDPKVFRVLSVTGNQAGMTQTVIVIGLDWGLRPVADAITLSGTATVEGVKAFRFVDKIILPAESSSGETVSVGTAEILGLHWPIAKTDDLLEIAQRTSSGTTYLIQSSTPTPSVERGTVDISALSPADDDSIEFTYRASK